MEAHLTWGTLRSVERALLEFIITYFKVLAKVSKILEKFYLVSGDFY